MNCVVSWPGTLERVEIDHPNNAMTPNHAASNGGGPSWLQWARLMAAVAELGLLGGRGDSWFFVHLN